MIFLKKINQIMVGILVSDVAKNCGKVMLILTILFHKVEAAATVFLIYNVCAKLATVPNKIAWDWIR